MSNPAPQIFFDASGLIKRYSPERGADLVDEIFNVSPTGRMACSYLGILEVISILIRQRNDKRLPRPAFEQAMAEFEAEVASNSQFTKSSVSDALLKSAIPFLAKHNLNATDTVILLSALNLQKSLRQSGEDLILCAADNRLARAAEAEGIKVFNPETDTLDTLRQMLGVDQQAPSQQ
jgi:predicted nucleic acid-binding protein